MDSSSNYEKQLKKANLEIRGDKISDFPDDILIRILSFLSTKEAFRTSLLSSRWEFLWVSVPNLEFNRMDITQGWGDCNQNNRFMDFIDRVLMHHDSNINQFHLEWCFVSDIYRLKTWLNVLVRRNVREIDIHGKSPAIGCLGLPRSLFTCKTLEVLKLNCLESFNVPTEVYFPCLKILHISLKNACNDLTQKLFCSCPMLEELFINVLDHLGESIYNISSPALKKLEIALGRDRSKLGRNRSKLGESDSVVHVDAPALESLHISDDSVHYDLKNPSSILEACVDIYVHHDDNQLLKFDKLFTLLSSVSTVKYLSLNICTVKVFEISFEKNWPAFPNLTHLKLLNYYNNLDSKILSRWPDFPNLMHLQLDIDENFDSRTFTDILAWAPNLSTLAFNTVHMEQFISSEQDEVQNCLHTRVKEIKLLGLDGINLRAHDGFHGELKMIKYFLEKAQVLEKLEVEICGDSWNVDWFKEKIIMLPRSSKICQVNVTWLRSRYTREGFRNVIR